MRNIKRIALGGLVLIAGFLLPACASNGIERPEALTGQSAGSTNGSLVSQGPVFGKGHLQYSSNHR